MEAEVSFSQYNQDRIVLQHHNNKKEGYFVEIGASDGILLSNCYLLEKYHGWRGVCIEPIPYKFSQLKKNRSSLCFDKAIFSKSGEVVEFSVHKYGSHENDGLSGITEFLDKHRTQVLQNETRIQVQTLTLNDLLDEVQAPRFIEYLSLDTEGTELEILKSVDLDKYMFGIMTVEHNFIDSKRQEIKEYLESKNYHCIGTTGVDDMFVPKGSPSL